MREIKFRAVRKSRFPELNEMCYGTGIFEDGINTWLLSHNPTKCLAEGFTNEIVDKNTIGQFTGLKDKNGKEIYEGDILRINKEYDEDSDIPSLLAFRAVVDFHRGAFWFTGINASITDCCWFQWNPEDMEVIGNIYESPTLLTP